MPMTFEEWTDLVQHHDLTYQYSDDNAVWRRGQASFDLIIREAANFRYAQVRRVWNDMVDRCLIPSAAIPFYWQHMSPDYPSHNPSTDVSHSEKEDK